MLVRVLQRNRTTRVSEYGGICVYMCVCVCVYIYIHIYIYKYYNKSHSRYLSIYLKREGEKERSKMRFIIETEKSQDLPSESWRSRNLVV